MAITVLKVSSMNSPSNILRPTPCAVKADVNGISAWTRARIADADMFGECFVSPLMLSLNGKQLL